jgi:crotonobetainyl-CoA:carnitine CoA-transferase CaiB-like acyl-CoA transferase
VLATLDMHEVVCAPVNDGSDIVNDPHFRERTLVEITGNDVLGRVLMPGPILHLPGYAGPSYDGVPEIGQHSRAVLADWIGVSVDDFDRLQNDGVVKQA